MTLWGSLGGAVAGALTAAGVSSWWRRRGRGSPRSDVLAVDTEYTLDLLRRADGAVVACLALESDASALSLGEPRPDQAVIDRVVATARLARGDGRLHTIEG